MSSEVARENAERKVLSDQLWMSSPLITWFQGMRRWFGIPAPNDKILPWVPTAMMILLPMLLFGAWGLFRSNVFPYIWDGFMDMFPTVEHKGHTTHRTMVQWLIWVIVLLIVIFILLGILVPFIYAMIFVPVAIGLGFTSFESNSEGFQTAPPTTLPQAAAGAGGAVATGGAVAARLGRQTASSPTTSAMLVNIQPIAVKQIGYVGPEETNGSFDSVNQVGIISALKTGVRFFTLQIDYLNQTKGDGFDKPLVPTLLYRDDTGNLISSNGMSLSDAVQALSSYAFNKLAVNGADQPLILYLHFLKTPNPLIDPTKYLDFLSNVALALGPLLPSMTGITPEGAFQRQEAESVLLHSPLSAFSQKVIVMTNADTTLFRNPAVGTYDLKADLDYMTNIRVYLDNSTDVLGVTEMRSNGTANAIAVSLKRLQGLTPTEALTFAKANRERFVIALPSQIGNPSAEEITTALTTLGVNVLPLNMFGETATNLKTKVSIWSGDPFTKLKPIMLLSQKPNVVGLSPVE